MQERTKSHDDVLREMETNEHDSSRNQRRGGSEDKTHLESVVSVKSDGVKLGPAESTKTVLDYDDDGVLRVGESASIEVLRTAGEEGTAVNPEKYREFRRGRGVEGSVDAVTRLGISDDNWGRKEERTNVE
jgi:hypothetical protein